MRKTLCLFVAGGFVLTTSVLISYYYRDRRKQPTVGTEDDRSVVEQHQELTPAVGIDEEEQQEGKPLAELVEDEQQPKTGTGKEAKPTKDKKKGGGRRFPTHFLSLRIPVDTTAYQQVQKIHEQAHQSEDIPKEHLSFFTPIEKMHITLFVMIVDDEKAAVPLIAEVLERSLSKEPAFNITFDGLDTFNRGEIVFVKVSCSNGDNNTDGSGSPTCSFPNDCGRLCLAVERLRRELAKLPGVEVEGIKLAEESPGAEEAGNGGAGADDANSTASGSSSNGDESLKKIDGAETLRSSSPEQTLSPPGCSSTSNFVPHATIAKMARVTRRKKKGKHGKIEKQGAGDADQEDTGSDDEPPSEKNKEDTQETRQVSSARRCRGKKGTVAETEEKPAEDPPAEEHRGRRRRGTKKASKASDEGGGRLGGSGEPTSQEGKGGPKDRKSSSSSRPPKRVPRELYADHAKDDYGSAVLSTVELCSMRGKGEDGYYRTLVIQQLPLSE